MNCETDIDELIHNPVDDDTDDDIDDDDRNANVCQ